MQKKLFLLILFYSIVYTLSLTKVYAAGHLVLNKNTAFGDIMSLKYFASNNFDIKYYRCEWETDPAIRFIKGKITAYFVITTATLSVSFDLVDSLKVDSVKNSNSTLKFSFENSTLLVKFNANKPAGTLDSISIYYQGVPPNTGLGSFVNSLHAGIPVMWTLSEPFGSMDWWPCKNNIYDKADSIDVLITTPSQYSAVSNGIRQSVTIAGDKKTTHWKHRYPIASFLICMAVTNYAEFEDHVQLAGTNLLMQTFCYPESTELFQQNTPKVLASMQYFSELLEPYPFLKEKYGHVQFGWAGGMEHQTSTFLIRPDESLMAHELAHQWFGNKVTCLGWRHIWLSESFATHLASMDMEKKYPLQVLATRKKEIDAITALPGGSVIVDDTTSVSRIFNARLSYTKGSHVLYMLRWILGDSVFFKALRSYLGDPQLRYDFATTTDMQRKLEEASGKKLDSFFNDWIYGEGFPSYHIQWEQIDDNYVRIKMNQATSHPSVKFFALPVALQFKNATQQKTIVADNRFNGETFFKEIGFVADTVIVDPEYWLITSNNSSEKIPDTINEGQLVQVFPNPFSQNLYVYLRNFERTNAAIKIYDSEGRLMWQEKIHLDGNLFRDISSPTLAKGLYYLKVVTKEGFSYTKKIVKQ